MVAVEEEVAWAHTGWRPLRVQRKSLIFPLVRSDYSNPTVQTMGCNNANSTD
jgi:hypothetical protein